MHLRAPNYGAWQFHWATAQRDFLPIHKFLQRYLVAMVTMFFSCICYYLSFKFFCPICFQFTSAVDRVCSKGASHHELCQQDRPCVAGMGGFWRAYWGLEQGSPDHCTVPILAILLRDTFFGDIAGWNDPVDCAFASLVLVSTCWDMLS